jgi:hypothetical protein
VIARRQLVTRRFAWVLAGCVLFTLAVAPVGSADCPATSVKIGPERTWPGALVTIRGAAWRGCDDTSSGCLPRTSSAPNEDISVTIRPVQGGALVVLGTIDRADDGAFSLVVEIPGLPTGRYVIEAESGRPAGVTATDRVRIVEREDST